ncbi:MAG TPA: response regulator transcription factor, partial [Bryobacteraceae bacterium]|nr:response regulator transcription factor [Bryobacteraceae bacterium]
TPRLVLLGDFYPAKPLLPLSLQIREQFPGTSVILWMMDFSDADRLRALQVGVKGVLQKTLPADALLRCLRAVARGEVWLGGDIGTPGGTVVLHREGNPRITPREREIVSLVAKGLKNKEIAAALSITAGTVKVHLMHIFEKTGVKDRFQLALQSQDLLGKGDQLPSSDMVEVFQS